MTETPISAPRITHSRILAMAIPAMLFNFSTSLPNLVATLLIGQIGDAVTLGGIAIGTALSSCVLFAFGFLQFGTTGFTAQAYNAEDGDEIKATLNRALSMAWIFGFILLLIMVPLAFVSLPLFKATEAVTDLAARYFHYRLFSAPFDLTNYVIFGWLSGLQRTRQAMFLQLLLNSLNVVLCWLFVYQFNFGVDGAAFAAALAQTVTAFFSLVVARRLLRIVPLSDDAGSLIDVDKLFILTSVNFGISLRIFSLLFVLAYFVGLSARMNEITLAANQIILVLIMTISHIFNGFFQSAEATTDQAIIEADRAQLGRAMTGCILWALILAISLAFLLERFGLTILHLFCNDPEIASKAAPYLPWLAISPLIVVWCHVFDGIFAGAKRSAEIRNSLIIAIIGTLIAQYFMIPSFGNHGLWASFMLFFVLKALILYLRYPRIGRALAQ